MSRSVVQSLGFLGALILIASALPAHSATVVFNFTSNGAWTSPFDGQVHGGRHFTEEGIYVEAIGFSSFSHAIYGSSFHTAESQFYFFGNGLSDRGMVLQMADGSPFDLVSLDYRVSITSRLYLHTAATRDWGSGFSGGWDSISLPTQGVSWSTKTHTDPAYQNITRLYLGLDGNDYITGLDNIVLQTAVPVPAAGWMLGMALIGLAGVVRRP